LDGDYKTSSLFSSEDRWMVSIGEALQQTSQAEGSATERAEEIRDIESQAGRLSTGGGLVSQIQAGSAQEFTRRRRAAKKSKRKTLEATATARRELGLFREQIASRKTQIRSIQAEQARQRKLQGEFELAKLLADDRSRSRANLPLRVRKLITQLETQDILTQRSQTQAAAFKKEGLTPQFIGGKLVGFESEKVQQSFEIGNLDIVQPSAIPGLEKAKIIEVTRTPSQPDKLSTFLSSVSTQQTTLPSAPSGEFGGISISAADDSLKTFIERKEPIGGTFEFLVEKVRGFSGKKEEKFTPGSQRLTGGITGERVSAGVQILPFVIPITAPAAFISTGISRFVTPGGRAEAKDIGLGIEQRFGIPAKVGEIGAFGLSALGIGIGGVGGVKQIEKALGLPKFNVKFLAQQQPIQNVVRVGEETFISTKGVAEVTRIGLLGERKAVSAFESLAKVKPGKDLFRFEAAIKGISREFKGVRFPSGKSIFGKPGGFGGLTSGLGKETEQLIKLELEALGGTATKTVEGFDFISSTKLFTQRGRDFDRFISVGKGFDLPSGIVTSSKAGRLDKVFKLSGEELSFLGKTGRAEIFGLTKRAPVEDIGGGSLILKIGRGDIGKAISEQTTKSVIAQAFPRSVADIFSTPSTKAVGGLKSIEKLFPSITQTGGRATGQFTGLGLFERTAGGLLPPTTKTTTIVSGLQLPSFKELSTSRVSSGLSSALKQPQKERLQLKELSSLVQISGQQTRQKALQKSAQRTLQLQRQRQTFRAPSFSDFFAPPTFAAGGFGGLLPPITRRGKRTKKKRVKVRGRIRTTLAPSFTAQALNLRGTFPKELRGGLGLLPSQFRLIPRRRRRKRR